MKTKEIKILLVEDNPGDVLLLQDALRSHEEAEITVIHEENLVGALKRLSAEEVDIILLDLYLPDTYGLETLAQLYKAYPKTPIIAMTGFHEERTTLHALNLGAQEYISKDRLDGKKLVEMLCYHADRQRNGFNAN